MALTQQEIDAVVAAAAADGLKWTIEMLQGAYAAKQTVDAKTELATAIEFTVSNWTTVDSFLTATTDSSMLYSAMAAIAAKLAAHDATDLDVLLLSFYAAGKVHLGP